MPNKLSDLLEQAKCSNHRQPLPLYEETHQFFINRQRMMCLLSRQLPRDRVLDGWVFSISVHEKDLEKAWYLIEKSLLTRHGGMLAMNIPDLKNDPCPGHYVRGNQVTLFTFKDSAGELLLSPKKVFHILRHVDEQLKEAGISPGVSIPPYQAIRGSSYVSIRNDRDHLHAFISEADALDRNRDCAFNPCLHDNPYETFDFRRSNGRVFQSKRDVSHATREFETVHRLI